MTLTRKYFSVLAILLFTLNPAKPNVTVTLGDVEVDGYTSDIVVPVTLVNPADAVGGFQFDIVATPHLLDISFVDPVDGDNFSADFNTFDDGSARVVFYSNTGGEIAAGSVVPITVLNLHYDGSDILSAIIDLEASNFTGSDGNGNTIGGVLVDGSITIGSFVALSSSEATGDVSEQVLLDINLDNTGLGWWSTI